MDDSQQTLKGIDTDSELEASDKTSDRMPGYVPVVGATMRPDEIDQVLQRSGHFHRFGMRVPDENARVKFLSVLTHNYPLEGGFDLSEIARFTRDFVRADLEALIDEAKSLAILRFVNKRSQLDGGHNDEVFDCLKHPWALKDLSITKFDFQEAIKLVKPSANLNGFTFTSDINWEVVGGYDLLKEEFNRRIVQRIKYPKLYEKFGVDTEVGFLLYGPTGCGKHLIVNALVNEAGANSIYVELPKYGGEREQEVRKIFSRAKACSPCIIFLNSIESWSIKRGVGATEEDFRILNQLLVELDGANERPDVYVIAATNKLDLVDSALLKRGRFQRLFYVPLPTAEERELILRALTRTMHVSPDIDYQAIARRKECMHFSGADLAGLTRKAVMVANKKKLCKRQGNRVFKPSLIGTVHFEEALKVVLPSVKEEDRRYHEAISKQFGSMV